MSQAEGQGDIVAGADRKRGEGGALAQLDGHQPVGHLIDGAVASQRGDDLEIGSVRLGQAGGVSGGFGQRGGHRMTKRLELCPCHGQALFPLAPPGRRVGDEQDTLGSHGRRSAHLADPVAGDGLQVTVAVGLSDVWGEVNPLKVTNDALQLVAVRGRQ